LTPLGRVVFAGLAIVLVAVLLTLYARDVRVAAAVTVPVSCLLLGTR
jgi:hypothetical protein